MSLIDGSIFPSLCIARMKMKNNEQKKYDYNLFEKVSKSIIFRVISSDVECLLDNSSKYRNFITYINQNFINYVSHKNIKIL